MSKKSNDAPLGPMDVNAIADFWEKEFHEKDNDVRRMSLKLLLIGLAVCRETEIWGKTFDLTRGEMAVLMALGRAGEARVRPTDLLVFLSMSSAGVTKQIGSLEERGLVDRQGNPTHRGGFLVGLSDPGRKLVAKIRLARGWGPLTDSLANLHPSTRRKAEEIFDLLLEAAHAGAEKRKSRAASAPVTIDLTAPRKPARPATP